MANHIITILDKFGIPREQVVDELISKNCKLGNIPHVDLYFNAMINDSL